MAAGGAHESTSVIVLTAEPRTPVGLTHRLKIMHGPTGWIATAFHDPHLAFAEMCLRERAQASRAAWGLQRVEKLSMVIVDPLRWPAVNDLVASIKRYTPTVSVWAYRDGQLQAVAAARPQQSSAADHAMTVLDADEEQQAMSDSLPVQALSSRSPQMSSRPLRLAGVDDQSEHLVVAAQSDANADAAANGRNSGSGSNASSASVTREEIDLLLQRREESSPSGGGGDGSRDSTGIPA